MARAWHAETRPCHPLRRVSRQSVSVVFRLGGNEIVVTLLLNLVAVSVLWWALDGPIRGRFSAGYPADTDNLS
jgi:hypothetical protein